jgi:hypothetical protein
MNSLNTEIVSPFAALSGCNDLDPSFHVKNMSYLPHLKGHMLDFKDLYPTMLVDRELNDFYGNQFISGTLKQGRYVTASGVFSHAEGELTYAKEEVSHAEGSTTIASGYGSHAEGYLATASNTYSHAEGISTHASGYGSHAEGYIVGGVSI